MRKKQIFAAFAALGMLFVPTGCELEEKIAEMETGETAKEYSPKYILSIHEIVKYPKADLLERDVETFSGDSICINVNACLQSKYIEKIRKVQRTGEPGFFDLVLTLNRRGMLLWSSVAYKQKGRKLACVIDGLCYRKFSPPQPVIEDDEEKSREVILEGPFDQVTASMLEKYSEKNYKHYNKK